MTFIVIQLICCYVMQDLGVENFGIDNKQFYISPFYQVFTFYLLFKECRTPHISRPTLFLFVSISPYFKKKKKCVSSPTPHPHLPHYPYPPSYLYHTHHSFILIPITRQANLSIQVIHLYNPPLPVEHLPKLPNL